MILQAGSLAVWFEWPYRHVKDKGSIAVTAACPGQKPSSEGGEKESQSLDSCHMLMYSDWHSLQFIFIRLPRQSDSSMHFFSLNAYLRTVPNAYDGKSHIVRNAQRIHNKSMLDRRKLQISLTSIFFFGPTENDWAWVPPTASAWVSPNLEVIHRTGET